VTGSAEDGTGRVSTVNDHRPAGRVRRSGNPAFRGVTVAAFLLVLAGTVYFAAESLNTDQPIFDLSVTAVSGFITVALAWIIVGFWLASRQDL